MTVLIAGSGPAGVFAALGALEAGAKVIMVDPGIELEPAQQNAKAELSRKAWTQWTAEDYAKLRVPVTQHVEKKVFGSDFSTRHVVGEVIEEQNCILMQSNARGGLSNIWGRGLEPPYQGECDHWSFKDEFFQSLRAIMPKIPMAAENDNLAQVMPLHCEPTKAPPLTTASVALLEKWQKYTSVLNEQGVHFGRTRLAFRVELCQLCAMCFYGCVYDALFTSGDVLASLAQNFPNFEYRPGSRVVSFNSTDGGVQVALQDIKTKQNSSLQADKLVLAAGSIQTTLITMRSLGWREATLKASDLIRIPMLNLFGPAPDEPKYHALSQLTLTIKNQRLTSKAMVMHIYGRNPAIDDAVLSRMPKFLHKLVMPFLRRFSIGMCFLHSDDSGVISVAKNDQGFAFQGKQPAKIWAVYAKLFVFLLFQFGKTGLLPLPLLGPAKLGSSVHYGASIVTDDKGRLLGIPVYVADAAGLPDIAAGSYTLSIMANAYRVGKNAATI